MRHDLLLPVLLASLTSGCCSYRGRPGHGHGPGHHGYATQLPAQPPPAIQPPTGGVVTATGTGVVGGGAGAGGAGGDLRWELKTEDFAVTKRSETNGVARIRKYVVSDQLSVPVRLCHDEFTVERAPASGSSLAPFWGGESVVEVPLVTEVAVPVLTPRVYEVVRVRTNTVCITNLVTGTVRTEKLETSKR